MGFLDRLFGRQPQQQNDPGRQPPAPATGYTPQELSSASTRGGSVQDAPPTADEDERAIARYRYLLRTAPPEKLEEAHTEAFARLSPEQRQQVLAQLSTDLPEAERPRSDDPREMARAATRAEVQQPGFMQRSFGMGGGGLMGGGMGMGGMIAGSMLGTIAGVVIGSAVADSLFGGYEQSPEAAQAVDTSGDQSDTGDQGDTSGDQADTSGADTQDVETHADFSGGGDFSGGDFSGGDFGGGDFGGGDF